MQSHHYTRAEVRLRALGARLTLPRVKVLGVLLEAEDALSHQQVLKRLRGIDRVTVYRVLQWLEQRGMVHKLADDERVWRFIAGEDAARAHAHFKCERCGRVTCLKNDAVPPQVRLPAGYRPRRVETTVRGLCSGCKAV